MTSSRLPRFDSSADESRFWMEADTLDYWRSTVGKTETNHRGTEDTATKNTEKDRKSFPKGFEPPD